MWTFVHNVTWNTSAIYHKLFAETNETVPDKNGYNSSKTHVLQSNLTQNDF